MNKHPESNTDYHSHHSEFVQHANHSILDFFFGGNYRKNLTVIIVFILVAIGVYIFVKPATELNDILILLSSSMLALIGVSITGYIFSSESLRKHTDEDYRFVYAAKEHKAGIMSTLKMQFAVAVVIIMIFTTIAHYVIPGFWAELLFAVSLFLFTIFTLWSLSLDIKMMDVNTGLKDSALKILNEEIDKLEKADLVININPSEYIELAMTPGLSGNYDLTKETKLSDNRYIIHVFRGKEGQKIGEPTDTRSSYLYRDMIDEFSPELALSVFDGIETIICKISGVSTSELHETDKKRLESVLGVGTGRREDSGMSEDIVDYYFLLSKCRDNFFIIDDYTEEPEKKQRSVTYSKHLCTNRLDSRINHVNKRTNKDVSDRGKDGRREDYVYVYHMTPYIYVLRYELCKKLEGMDLSGLNLSTFDFSYGDMRRAFLKGTLLMGASFYSCNLEGANLVGCDLSSARFKFANCENADFTGAKVNDVSLQGVALSGSKFLTAEVSDSIFPSNLGIGINFKEAALVYCAFLRCYFPDSNFHGANIINCELNRTVFKDADFSRAKVGSCMIYDSNMFGCDFTGSTFNFTTMKDTSLRLSKFESVEMTSNIFINNSFDNCQIKTVNFTGSEIFSCLFNSAQVSDCDFTRVVIMPYRISEETRLRIENIIENRDTTLGEDRRHKVPGDEICNFTNSFMMACLYTDAIVKYSDFTYAILQRSVVSNTIFENCLFDYGSLMEMYFADSIIDRCSFRFSNLTNSNITSCIFEKCRFDSSSLSMVTITDSSFIGCTFDNVDVTGLKLIDTSWENVELGEILDFFVKNPGSFIKIIIKEGNTYHGKMIQPRLDAEGAYEPYPDVFELLNATGITKGEGKSINLSMPGTV